MFFAEWCKRPGDCGACQRLSAAESWKLIYEKAIKHDIDLSFLVRRQQRIPKKKKTTTQLNEDSNEEEHNFKLNLNWIKSL